MYVPVPETQEEMVEVTHWGDAVHSAGTIAEVALWQKNIGTDRVSDRIVVTGARVVSLGGCQWL